MRVKVTNTDTATVCRVALVFRGGSVNEVVVPDEYALREIRACRQLTVEVLEDRTNSAVSREVAMDNNPMEPEGYICACGFVAKNKAGLSAHKRHCG